MRNSDGPHHQCAKISTVEENGLRELYAFTFEKRSVGKRENCCLVQTHSIVTIPRSF